MVDVKRNYALVGVPMDLGGARRGTDMAPNSVRIANICEKVAPYCKSIVDYGNIEVPDLKNCSIGSLKAKYEADIFKTCEKLRDTVIMAVDDKYVPLVIGGDHSVACGTISGLVESYAKLNKKIGLVWLDAHADINTPATSLSGNVHGMPLGVCLGNSSLSLLDLASIAPMIDVSKTVLVGIRSVDDAEKEIINDLNLKTFTMTQIDELGISRVMDEILEVVCDDTVGFHVSFDLDVVDPMYAPGVSTPSPGGLTDRESHFIMKKMASTNKIIGLEFTEINPVLDEKNKTSDLCVALAQSALGKKVL